MINLIIKSSLLSIAMIALAFAVISIKKENRDSQTGELMYNIMSSDKIKHDPSLNKLWIVFIPILNVLISLSVLLIVSFPGVCEKFIKLLRGEDDE